KWNSRQLRISRALVALVAAPPLNCAGFKVANGDRGTEALPAPTTIQRAGRQRYLIRRNRVQRRIHRLELLADGDSDEVGQSRRNCKIASLTICATQPFKSEQKNKMREFAPRDGIRLFTFKTCSQKFRSIIALWNPACASEHPFVGLSAPPSPTCEPILPTRRRQLAEGLLRQRSPSPLAWLPTSPGLSLAAADPLIARWTHGAPPTFPGGFEPHSRLARGLAHCAAPPLPARPPPTAASDCAYGRRKYRCKGLDNYLPLGDQLQRQLRNRLEAPYVEFAAPSTSWPISPVEFVESAPFLPSPTPACECFRTVSAAESLSLSNALSRRSRSTRMSTMTLTGNVTGEIANAFKIFEAEAEVSGSAPDRPVSVPDSRLRLFSGCIGEVQKGEQRGASGDRPALSMPFPVRGKESAGATPHLSQPHSVRLTSSAQYIRARRVRLVFYPQLHGMLATNFRSGPLKMPLRTISLARLLLRAESAQGSGLSQWARVQILTGAHERSTCLLSAVTARGHTSINRSRASLEGFHRHSGLATSAHSASLLGAAVTFCPYQRVS
uniref:Protein kinase domain-containing protein n=1 Tax=Macrostomum lignano TaxID=282301 RepID=A0A1I8FQB2_9PLAT